MAIYRRNCLTPVDRYEVFGEVPQGDAERIAPGFFPASVEKEHLARYIWSSQWVRQKLVLDLACGTGYGSRILMQAGAKGVTALDRSSPALRFASIRYPGPNYIQANAQELPYDKDSFDVVVSIETIEHLADPLLFLRGVQTALKKNGLLVLSTPNKRRTGHWSNPYHLSEVTLPKLCKLLAQTAFHVVETWGQFWGPLRRTQLWRIKGLKFLSLKLEQVALVMKWPAILGFEPLYWCILARKQGIQGRLAKK